MIGVYPRRLTPLGHDLICRVRQNSSYGFLIFGRILLKLTQSGRLSYILVMVFKFSTRKCLKLKKIIMSRPGLEPGTMAFRV